MFIPELSIKIKVKLFFINGFGEGTKYSNVSWFRLEEKEKSFEFRDEKFIGEEEAEANSIRRNTLNFNATRFG